jgi:acetyltransferase-like isoleucine patch superfamily enzyme
MAFVLADRVKETTTVTGTTSPISLLGAATGFQSFAAIGNANVTYYTIAGQTGSEWEVGIGTYTSSGTTLSRDTVLSSSNGGALVNFSAGTKDVWCDYPAGRAVQGADGYIENDATISVSSTINTGNNAISGGPITINSGITVTVPSGSVWTVV